MEQNHSKFLMVIRCLYYKKIRIKTLLDSLWMIKVQDMTYLLISICPLIMTKGRTVLQRNSLWVNYPLDPIIDFLACSSETLGSFGYRILGCMLLGLRSASASPLLFDTNVKGMSVGRTSLLLPPSSFVNSSQELCRENFFLVKDWNKKLRKVKRIGINLKLFFPSLKSKQYTFSFVLVCLPFKNSIQSHKLIWKWRS